MWCVLSSNNITNISQNDADDVLQPNCRNKQQTDKKMKNIQMKIISKYEVKYNILLEAPQHRAKCKREFQQLVKV